MCVFYRSSSQHCHQFQTCPCVITSKFDLLSLAWVVTSVIFVLLDLIQKLAKTKCLAKHQIISKVHVRCSAVKFAISDIAQSTAFTPFMCMAVGFHPVPSISWIRYFSGCLPAIFGFWMHARVVLSTTSLATG